LGFLSGWRYAGNIGRFAWTVIAQDQLSLLGCRGLAQHVG
jgi:hypothetical protein